MQTKLRPTSPSTADLLSELELHRLRIEILDELARRREARLGQAEARRREAETAARHARLAEQVAALAGREAAPIR